MIRNNTLTAEALRALLAYDPATGSLTWRLRDAQTLAAHGLAAPDDVALWNEHHAGADACHGNFGRDYLVVRIGGRRYKAQRVAWAMHHGSWPAGQVRFVGAERSDLRIGNLHVPSLAPARQPGAMQVNNRSGATGVHWRRSKRRWRARISVDGQRVELGEFSKFGDAVRARREAEQRYRVS